MNLAALMVFWMVEWMVFLKAEMSELSLVDTRAAQLVNVEAG